MNQILVNNFDLSVAKQNYNTLLNGGADVILSFGITNNKVLTEQTSFPKPTILFGAAISHSFCRNALAVLQTKK